MNKFTESGVGEQVPLISPHSKLIHVGLPHENGSLVKQLLDYSGAVGWPVVYSKTREGITTTSFNKTDCLPVHTNLSASWMHMWSGCLLCRNCPWLQRGFHLEDLSGHLRENICQKSHRVEKGPLKGSLSSQLLCLLSQLLRHGLTSANSVHASRGMRI